MRHMSFALTTPQMRAKTKTVTRRKGWLFLEPGDRLQAVVKGQGLKKGERVEKIGVIEVVSVRRESLNCIMTDDLILEGLPHMLSWEFKRMYRAANGGGEFQTVTRIEFQHVGARA